MAAIPAAQVGKNIFQEWIRITNMLIDLSAFTASDSLTTTLTKAATESAAH